MSRWHIRYIIHASISQCTVYLSTFCCLTPVFLSLQLLFFATTSCHWFTSSTCCCCRGFCVPTNTPSEVGPSVFTSYIAYGILHLIVVPQTSYLSIFESNHCNIRKHCQEALSRHLYSPASSTIGMSSHQCCTSSWTDSTLAIAANGSLG